MKQTLYLLASILFVLNTLSAQETKSIQNYFGLYGGGGLGTFNSNLSVEYPYYFVDLKSAGVAFRTFSGSKTALHLELGYTEKGGLSFFDKNYFGSDTVGMDKAEYFVYKTKGIELAALTHLAFGGGKSKFVLNFGPYGYYSFHGSVSAIEGETNTKSLKPDKNYDLGVKAGIGYSLHLNKNVFELEIKYAHGFINVYELDRINSALMTQNQALTFNLIYFRKLKNKN